MNLPQLEWLPGHCRSLPIAHSPLRLCAWQRIIAEGSGLMSGMGCVVRAVCGMPIGSSGLRIIAPHSSARAAHSPGAWPPSPSRPRGAGSRQRGRRARAEAKVAVEAQRACSSLPACVALLRLHPRTRDPCAARHLRRLICPIPCRRRSRRYRYPDPTAPCARRSVCAPACCVLACTTTGLARRYRPSWRRRFRRGLPAGPAGP